MEPSLSPSSSIPSDRVLDQAVRVLADRGDHVGVIQIVEGWAAQGSPTQAARLAAGTAFYRLRMMDRAMTRAREVLDQEPENIAALLLLTRIYLDRGWPAKARPLVQVLRTLAGEGDPEAAELWERANAEPVRPDANARQIEREGDPAKLVALAESFLATGSFLRATGILERLRRTDPDNPRVRELLWGVSGDTSAGDMPLSQVVKTLVPVLPVPHTLSALPEEPEHTESYSETTQNDLESEPGEAGPDQSFPSLFKHGPAQRTDDGDDPGEHTHASMLASAAEMGEAGEPEHTDSGGEPNGAPRPSGGGDTQIMLVLRPGEDVKGAAHRKKEAGRDGLRESLNLREYQASMGMSGAIADPYGSDLDVTSSEEKSELGLEPEERDVTDDGEDLLEEEDENLVVMTRSADDQPTEDRHDAVFDGPIEVIEKHAIPLIAPAPPAIAQPAGAEIEPDHEPDHESEPLPPPVFADAPVASPSNRWLIIGLAAGALAMLGAFFLIVWSRLSGSTSEDAVRESLVATLATADYDRLLTEESRLDGQQRGKSAPAVSAALAEARLVLWSDFNGDPGRMEYVERFLVDPAGVDTHRLAMLRAEYDLAREDYAGAAAAVSREEPQDDEERLLFARLAARTEDPTRALEHFTRMSRPDSPRYAVARAEILADAGRIDEAKAVANDLLHGSPDSVMANLALVKLTRGAPKDRIAAADFFLSRFRGQTIAPRIEGQVHAVRARAYGEFGLTGKAREAADAGLARDGTNADLLLVVAEDEASRGQLVDALREVETVVASRPGNADSEAACVLLQLDLDRVTDAERVVAGLRQRQLLPDLTPVLEGLVTVWGRSTPPAQPISPAQAATPLGAWLDALIAVQSHDPAADARVASAVALLKASPAPFERRLAARAAALAVLVAPAEEASKRADAVQEEQNLDPVAHVYLARFYESSGRRALAAQHFDRACELGPQLGLAWYEKGRFYQDARDSLGRSVAAWKTYLQLAPTGPRADRVAAALRRP